MSLRESLLSDMELKRVAFPCPEWPSVDGHVFIAEVGALERARFVDSISDADTAESRVRDLCRLLTICMVNVDGVRIFGEGDVEQIGGRGRHALKRAFDVAMEINGLKRNAVDDAVKNCESAPTDN